MIELLMVAQTETYVWSTETDAKRFFLFKPYWGQPRTKSYDEIANPGNGYLFDKGQILFGVDVLVTETFNKWEVFSFTENLHNRFYKWEITSFSSLEKQFYLSDEFTIGGRNWWVPDKWFVGIMNQKDSNHVEKQSKVYWKHDFFFLKHEIDNSTLLNSPKQGKLWTMIHWRLKWSLNISLKQNTFRVRFYLRMSMRVYQSFSLK